MALLLLPRSIPPACPRHLLRRYARCFIRSESALPLTLLTPQVAMTFTAQHLQALLPLIITCNLRGGNVLPSPPSATTPLTPSSA